MLDDVVYLNTGASGPTPEPVQSAVEDSFRGHGDSHVDSPYGYAEEVFDGVREAVADHVDASVEQVALTSNTTDAINAAADCRRWSEGDKVVTTELEHPAGVLPWQRLRRVRGVDVEMVSGDEDGVDHEGFLEAVDDADLACFSSRSWYGVDVEVEELVDVAHDAGCEVVVDAAQTVGSEEVDVSRWGADYVAAPGHKWLMAPWGTGFLYVEEPGRCKGQTRVGYRSTAVPEGEGSLYPDARRFHVSTESPALYSGLEAALEVVESVGMDDVAARVEVLASRLAEGLGDRVVSVAGGLVRFRDSDAKATVEGLGDLDVVVRSLPDDSVRASVHAFNTREDVDRLLEAV